MPHTHRAADLTKYAPETWNQDQRRSHEAISLEDAFYKASCLAGGWYKRPVIIWYFIDDNNFEHYRLTPEGSTPDAPNVHRCYKVEALDR